MTRASRRNDNTPPRRLATHSGGYTGSDLVATWAPPALALDFSLTPTAYRLMLALATAPTPGGWLPITQREIAEALHLDPRHTGRTLRNLARAGYVERIRWRGPCRFAYRTRRLAASA